MARKNTSFNTTSQLQVFKIYAIALEELRKVCLHLSYIKDDSYPGKINVEEQKYKFLQWCDETHILQISATHTLLYFLNTWQKIG